MISQKPEYVFSTKDKGEYPHHKKVLVDTPHFRIPGTISFWKKFTYNYQAVMSTGYRVALPEQIFIIGTLYYPKITLTLEFYEKYSRPWGSHAEVVQVIL